jgi:hypothetical protein
MPKDARKRHAKDTRKRHASSTDGDRVNVVIVGSPD